jgi:hypothetical protein
LTHRIFEALAAVVLVGGAAAHIGSRRGGSQQGTESDCSGHNGQLVHQKSPSFTGCYYAALERLHKFTINKLSDRYDYDHIIFM